MDFTIYTLGDVEIFRAALTSTAMLFSSDGGAGFVGTGGVGLGTLAVFALLISLMLILLQGVMRQKVEVGEFIILIMVFSVLFVPKFTVQIEDYYDSGQIAKVDNVPLGIAFPAAMMSVIVKNVNDLTATVYSTTEGGYYTNVVTPLRILTAFRRAGLALQGVNPALTKNLRTYALWCLAGRAEFDDNAWRTATVENYKTVLFSTTVQGGMTQDYTSDPQGTPVSCAVMREKLQTDQANSLDAFYQANTQFGKVLNTATGISASKGSVGGSQVRPLTPDDYETAFINLTGGTSDSARNFALMNLFTPQINGSLYCAPSAASNKDMEQCMAFASATSQWAEDSAAAGTFFQRLMVNGMNGLLFLFFCLAPVVAIIMLMTGIRGLKIAGAYLLFGAWAQSWFVGASIINFYIQKQIQNELAMNGGIQNLNWSTMGQFLDSMQMKMGLAGDMLSSVPLIMMAIMSGSVYGMVQVANRWGSRENYNEKINTPETYNPGALHTETPMTSRIYGGASGTDNRFGEGPSFDFSYGLKLAQQSSIQSQHQVSDTLQHGMSDVLKHGIMSGTSAQRMNQFADTLAANGQDQLAAVFRDGAKVANSHGLSNEEKESRATQLEAKLAAAFGGGGINGGGSASIGKRWEKSEAERVASESGKDVGHGLDSGKSAAQSTGLSWGDTRQVGKMFQDAFGKDMQESYGESWNSVKSFVESGSNSFSAENAFGGKQTISGNELLNRVRETHTDDFLNAQFSNYSSNSEYHAAYERAAVQYRGISDPEQRTTLQKIKGLEAAAIAGDSGAKHAYAEFVERVSGNTANFSRPTEMTGDTYRKDGGEWGGKADRGHDAKGPGAVESKLKGGTGGVLGKDMPKSKDEAQHLVDNRNARNSSGVLEQDKENERRTNNNRGYMKDHQDPDRTSGGKIR